MYEKIGDTIFKKSTWDGIDYFIKPLLALDQSGFRDDINIQTPLKKIPMKKVVIDSVGDLWGYVWIDKKPYFFKIRHFKFH